MVLPLPYKKKMLSTETLGVPPVVATTQHVVAHDLPCLAVDIVLLSRIKPGQFVSTTRPHQRRTSPDPTSH
ncbi:hypothetical protein IAQ61_002611 [Plenodomus lingam]|uniref:uncharacterized protein n=1 Tax=Leptosphaeria maculans TaxID=5022 RepID=UPI0033275B0F|nr:hypothetical protein IAQ61_002611 [Plenodomus lingam]